MSSNDTNSQAEQRRRRRMWVLNLLRPTALSIYKQSLYDYIEDIKRGPAKELLIVPRNSTISINFFLVGTLDIIDQLI